MDAALDTAMEKLLSSSSDDSSMQDDQSSIQHTVQRARAARDLAPHDYNLHLTLINALRAQADDFDELRNARKQFATHFPLAPSVWKQWIEDEIQMASSAADRDYILLFLFPRSLSDYFSHDLHIMRLRFAIDMWRAKHIPYTLVRDLFQNSQWLAADAHFVHGAHLCTMYLAFVDECTDMHATRHDVVRQFNSIPFQLAQTPSDSLQDTVMDCNAFETRLKNAGSDASREHGHGDEHTIMQYRSYAEYAKGESNTLAISVYERYVSECYLSSEAWLEYIQYCHSIQDNSRAYFVSNRASRNIPYKLHIWAQCFISLCDASDWMLQTSREQTFVDLVNRTASHVMDSDDHDGAEIVTKTAWTTYYALELTDQTKQAVQQTLEFNVHGSMQWASACCHAALILKLCADFAGAERMLQSVVEISGSQARWWLKYCSLAADITPGEPAQVRKLFERGVAHVGTVQDVDVLLDAWIEFETRTGADKMAVRKGVSHAIGFAQRQRLKLPQVIRTSSGFGWAGDAATGTQRTKSKDRSHVRRKRAKIGAGKADGEKAVEMGTATDSPVKEDNGQSVMEAEKESEVVPEISPADAVSTAKSEDQEGEADSKAKKTTEQKDQTTECEPNTIFINNLAFTVTEADLRKAFEFAGTIKAVRLPRRSDGASKGVAYVEFADDACVEKALTMHNRPVNGRGVWVRRSKPPPRKSRKARGAANNTNKTRGGRVKTRERADFNMQPRAVQRRTIIAAASASATGDNDTEMADGDVGQTNATTETVSKPKSQDDFRAYFLQKKS